MFRSFIEVNNVVSSIEDSFTWLLLVFFFCKIQSLKRPRKFKLAKNHRSSDYENIRACSKYSEAATKQWIKIVKCSICQLSTFQALKSNSPVTSSNKLSKSSFPQPSPNFNPLLVLPREKKVSVGQSFLTSWIVNQDHEEEAKKKKQKSTKAHKNLHSIKLSETISKSPQKSISLKCHKRKLLLHVNSYHPLESHSTVVENQESLRGLNLMFNEPIFCILSKQVAIVIETTRRRLNVGCGMRMTTMGSTWQN